MMKKFAILGLFLFGLCFSTKAQTTSVSATVNDPTGRPYTGCSASISYVPAPTATTVPTINGSTFQTVLPLAKCDSFGNFSVTLTDNNLISDGHSGAASQWNFSIQSASTCFSGNTVSFQVSLTITGASQNISSALSAAAAPLPNCGVSRVGASNPIVATPNPITGSGTISCPSCLTAANGTNANQVLTGGFVEWTSLLNFTVGAATYSISGVNYSSPLTNITLATADPTNPRIDTIYVDNTGAVGVLTGTPNANPLAPAVNPATQLQLTFVYVAATATVPTQITKIDIYHSNTEWTSLASPATNPPWNLASTNFPYDTLVDIEATTPASGNYVSLTVPSSGTVDLGQSNTLVFYIRSKATWPSTASLTVQWYNGAVLTGSAAVLRDGSFGFSSSVTSGYTQIAMPNSLFGINGIPVTTVRFSVSGTGSNPGFYLDDITLQAGNAPVTLPTGIMIFRNAWSSTTAYNANDVVIYNNSLYVALQAGTGQTPVSSGTYWAQTNPATVTSVSMASIPPLATCSTATATTTPAITCTPSTFAPFTAYANATSSTAAPTAALIGQPISGANTTGSYAVVAADRTSIKHQNSAGASAWSIAQAGTTGFTGNFYVTLCDDGAGTLTLTPTTSTISYWSGTTYTSAASTMPVTTGQCASLWSDNSNYYASITGSASQYRQWLACDGKGIGDGLNAIPAGTYLMFTCKNTTPGTVTITGVQCLTDNAGSSTLNAAGNTLGALLTGTISCSSSYVAGTQSANTLLTSGDYIKFTFVSDGTSKQTDWIVTGTY